MKKQIRTLFVLIFGMSGITLTAVSLIIAICGHQGRDQISHYALFLPMGAGLSFLLSWVLADGLEQ